MARTGGRQKGTPNKITTAFKDAVRIVYEDIGGHKAFAAWARENPTEFYKIAARLIPTEITARSDNNLTVVIRRFPRHPKRRPLSRCFLLRLWSIDL